MEACWKVGLENTGVAGMALSMIHGCAAAYCFYIDFLIFRKPSLSSSAAS